MRRDIEAAIGAKIDREKEVLGGDVPANTPLFGNMPT